MALLDLWNQNPEQLRNKQVHQLIGIAGEGRLLDQSPCSKEFRSFLSTVPSQYLQKYADQCLAEGFDGSGFALQDIVNEVGARLGATASPGLYRGKPNATGWDGLWNFPNGRSIVIEVKTTDVYSINLNTVAGYRRSLISEGEITEDTSSMLLVVGRQETDNLEAQIRGSKFAWNIRVISVSALLRLMFIKEEVEDPVLVQRIHAILVPHEFTRLDAIAELLFSAAQEIKQEEPGVEVEEEAGSDRTAAPKIRPVSFHEECVARVQSALGLRLVRRTRAGYSSPDQETAILCAVSKEHDSGSSPNYWFAFYPHQQTFLEQYKKTFVVLGCGSSQRVVLVPYNTFKSWLGSMWTTTNELRTYWHIIIHRRDEALTLRVRKGKKPIDLTPFVL